MYTKLFSKILDSSIWLESVETRIVWVTLLASMDQDGFCAFSAPENLSRRAIISLDATIAAIATLEGPDANSADPENNGRRIERVPGGWIILNAEKYRAIATRAVSQEQNRERVRRFRAKKSAKV